VQAAIRGPRRLAAPVIFSILTNVVAFIPLLFIPGETGQFWRPLPIVVDRRAAALALRSALHPAGAPGARPGMDRKRGAHPAWSTAGFHALFRHTVERFYRPLLEFTLRARDIAAAAALALLMIVVSYSTSAHMGLILMPEVSANEIEAGVRLPVGTTPDQAAAVAKAVTAATLGSSTRRIRRGRRRRDDQRARPVFIDVELVMLPPDERELSAREVIAIWRDSIGDLPGVDQITFEAERGPGGYRRDISVDLSHSDIDSSRRPSRGLRVEAAESLRRHATSTTATTAARASTTSPAPRRASAGADACGCRRAAARCLLRLACTAALRGTNEIEVRVKLPEAERKDVVSLEMIVIRTPTARRCLSWTSRPAAEGGLQQHRHAGTGAAS
jgi:multidrug efflux pump subunit AcrB